MKRVQKRGMSGMRIWGYKESGGVLGNIRILLNRTRLFARQQTGIPKSQETKAMDSWKEILGTHLVKT